MKEIEERNLVWNLVELIIIKNGLNIDMESLDPKTETKIEFGDYVSGHPMDFEEKYEKTIIEISRKLPNSYKISNSRIFGTGEGHIGIMKME